MTAAASAAIGAVTLLTMPLPRSESPPVSVGELWQSGFRYQVSRPVNILVMGLDEARDIAGAEPDSLLGRTDTLLLVRVDPAAEETNVLSIPRDTRVAIPGYGVDKINQANYEGGAELVAQAVSYNLGGVEIDRYMRVNTGAFREIVDLVGGVEVMVPKPMQYEDQTQGLVIDLEPGLQTLNGDQAEQFARFRQDAYGDIGRVQRQQILLKALRSRMASPAIIPKLPQIVRVLQAHIDTNLTLEEMLALASFGLQLDASELHMVMLPGRFSTPDEYIASFWIPDRTASGEVMQSFFHTPPVELIADSDRAPRLRIAVQNATAAPYAGQDMANYLRDQGFEHVYVLPDRPEAVLQTQVIAQRGDLDSADRVMSALTIGQIVSDSTGDIDSDITVRVGEDWLEQPAGLDGEADEGVYGLPR